MKRDFYHLGLTGWPLGHSLSPLLHRAALDASGLAGEYRLYPLPPTPEGLGSLAGLAVRLREGTLDGLNVTIPHKQAILPLVDDLSPAARAIGAANTLVMRGGLLLGENTDAPGFLADLRAQLGVHLPQIPGRALVLGAGGSARAVIYALAGAGWQVCVAARRIEQAGELVASLRPALPAAGLSACSLDVSGLSAQEPPDLIVNTTPLGMTPNTGSSPWPEELPLPVGAAVYDLVYNPRETRLIKAARRAGLPGAGGLGMLVEQAALAFELWTGVPVQREVMLRAVD
jgi:shikimate dehydrogenase